MEWTSVSHLWLNLLFISSSLCKVVCGIPGPSGSTRGDGEGDQVEKEERKT